MNTVFGAPWRPGHTIKNLGTLGIVVEVTTDHSAACGRHERLEAWREAQHGKERPGVLLLFSLVGDAKLLHVESLRLASGPSALAYRAADKPMIEFTDRLGWRDRRHLPMRTLELIHANGGCAVSAADRRRAARIYLALVPEAVALDPWKAMVTDAASWWCGRVTRDELDHALHLRRLNALPQSALARRVSELPLLTKEPDEVFPAPPERPTPAAHVRSDQDVVVLKALLADIASVARDRVSRPAGRARIVAHVDTALALVTGADAFHLLTGLRLAVTEGGLRGTKLAPRTLASYLGAALLRMYGQLAGMQALDWTTEQTHERYTAMLDAAPKTVRKNLAIFLTTFHRYLVVVGAEPLLRPLHARAALYPPDAAILWPHEISLALEYANVRAPTEKIRLQVRLMLRLGAVVPLRPEEFWSLLYADVHDDGTLTLRIWTRVADGGPKALATRRTEDISDPQVAAAVLELRDHRKVEVPQPGERLMGDRRSPDGCHAVRTTEKLLKEAMVWATGYSLCSIYHLRHTAISNLDRRIRSAQPGDRTSTDGVPHLQLQARTGQACRRSVESYLHRFEEDLELSSRHWRPAAWVEGAAYRDALANLSVVEEGLVGARSALPQGVCPEPLSDPALVPPAMRRRILRDVLDDYPFDAIAVLEYCHPHVVSALVKQFTDCAAAANLISTRFQRTDPGRCLALRPLRSWQLAADAAKLAPVVRFLDAVAAHRGSAQSWETYFVWTRCVSKEWVSLGDGYAAKRLIEVLRHEAQIPADQLFIAIAPGREALPEEVAQLNLQQVPAERRKGRKPFRLVLLPRGMRWGDAAPRHRTMLGLHWHFLILGSLLMPQG